jgi:hypothetical protein
VPTRRTTLQFEGLELNQATRRVERDGRSIALTPREFDLLQLLLEQPRRVYPKRAILEHVCGFDLAGDDNIVEVYVRYLRHKLNQDGAPPLIGQCAEWVTHSAKVSVRPRAEWQGLGLGTQLTIGYLVLLGILLALFGGFVYVGLERSLEANTLDFLRHESGVFERSLRATAAGGASLDDSSVKAAQAAAGPGIGVVPARHQ